VKRVAPGESSLATSEAAVSKAAVSNFTNGITVSYEEIVV
jgi:hypothetical protein